MKTSDSAVCEPALRAAHFLHVRHIYQRLHLLLRSALLLLLFSFFSASGWAAVGRFLDAPQYPTAGFVEGAAVGDFNGDGIPDLATCGVGDSRSTVSILLGNGDGTFQTHNEFNNTVSVLLGNGDGTFQRHVEYTAGNFPKSVAIGDFNGDGKLDIVVANYESNLKQVNVLLGNGDGTFGPAVAYGAGQLPVSVV